MENTKQKASAKQKLTIAAIFGAMGPGLLAALSGNDAGGIATYSSAGASYGYKMLWMLPVMTVLLIVTQETAARCGCVTGKGLASLIRERFGVRKSVLAMAALLIANTAVTISEFAGIASGLALFGVPASISVPLVALLVWMLTMSGSFQRIEKILLLVSCVFVTYIVAAFMAGPNWGEVAVDLVVPNIQNDPSYVSLVVATIGTTIAPWMIFLAQNNVVDKNAGEDDIVLQRIDTVSGSIAADIIAGFIIITTGTVLFPAGIQISDAADAARALEPIAGQWSTVLFASGLVAASFLAACVLPGVTSSAICEAFGWERGRSQLGRGPGISRHHYGHHRYLCRTGAYAWCRSVPDYDDLAGHQRRAVARGFGVSGGYCRRPSHYGRQPQRPRVECAYVGDYQRDHGADGCHVCPAGDGLQRLAPLLDSKQAAAMGCCLYFACYRGLVICVWTKNAKYEYCCLAYSIYN